MRALAYAGVRFLEKSYVQVRPSPLFLHEFKRRRRWREDCEILRRLLRRTSFEHAASAKRRTAMRANGVM